jgi:signal transduction histidine kinase/anti-sigma regulatory factor (Ser/Thr protein kinase)
MGENKKLEDLLKAKADLEEAIAEEQKGLINFSVDAAIINRLGYELVGKAETAISEIIKNSYDADATNVKVEFIDVDKEGGKLIISDNGHGMDYESLKNGFMRLSSSSKVKTPTSPKFKRQRAGRKGIGRFAAQRLGKQLTVFTKTEDGETFRLNIDWDDYEMDKDLMSIYNSIEKETEEKIDTNGTVLVISDLREKWTISQIKRVYRHISGLLKPDFSFDKDLGKNIYSDKALDTAFDVEFNKITNGETEKLEDIQRFLFENALATLEGYVTADGEGFCSIQSSHLEIEEELFGVSASDKKNETKIVKYSTLKNVHFKIYYYIFNRHEYYKGVSKQELNKVLEKVRDFGSVWVYKNGFRVLPYGTLRDDWLKINIQKEGVRGRLGLDFNMPIANNNLAGFVELDDPKEDIFMETSNREGLIENVALEELRTFIFKATTICLRRAQEKVFILRKKSEKEKEKQAISNITEFDEGKSTDELIGDLSSEIKELAQMTGESSDSETTNKSSNDKENTKEKAKRVSEILTRVVVRMKAELDEKRMLRVLAALGTTIGEFTHEITHFTGAFAGNINKIYQLAKNKEVEVALDDLEKSFELFTTYTAHFEKIVRKNAKRTLEVIDMPVLINSFVESIKNSSIADNIDIKVEFYDPGILTCPMHQSEWNSILFNLFTNSKKAIAKIKSKGNIKIDVYIEDGKIFLDFMDDGIGILEEHKNRIFNAFFTTSNVSVDEEEMTGTGLGLKIIKDIILDYKGDIYLSNVDDGYKTCFTIEIPEATEQQKLDND